MMFMVTVEIVSMVPSILLEEHSGRFVLKWCFLLFYFILLLLSLQMRRQARISAGGTLIVRSASALQGIVITFKLNNHINYLDKNEFLVLFNKVLLLVLRALMII